LDRTATFPPRTSIPIPGHELDHGHRVHAGGHNIPGVVTGKPLAIGGTLVTPARHHSV